MSIVKQVFPQCDFCLETYPDDIKDNVKEVKEIMKSEGWKVIEGKDICFDCLKVLFIKRSHP